MPHGDLGPYRLEALLGKGGMGEVHRAVDRRTGRPVALKLLPADLARDAERVARFLQEQAALAAIDHPNIVRPLSPVEQFGEVWCFAMELIPSVNLATLLRHRGRLSPPEAAFLALQTLSALGATHARGIVHRDIKPSNLLLDFRGGVHVTDFGLARAGDATRLTLTGQMLGTPEYMSPEQADGKDPDVRSDVYAVGCVLYESLAGRPPFRTSHPLATLRMHLDASVPLIPDLPAALQPVLDRALAKDPAARFQTAREMSAAVRDAVPEAEAASIRVEPFLARDGSAETVCDPPARRRTGGLLLGVVLVVAAGGVWYFLRPSPTVPPRRMAIVQVEGIQYRGDIGEIRAGQLQLREPGGIVRYWPVAAIERITYEEAPARER